MDMSKEKEPNELLQEGWRKLEILDCVKGVSKNGNDMFEFTFGDVLTYQQLTIFAIAIPGKRWFLKSILKACDIKANEDGVYDWDESNVIGKMVLGFINNIDELWIDRNGQERTTNKSKLSQVKSKDFPIPKEQQSE